MTLREIKSFLSNKGWTWTHKCGCREFFMRGVSWNRGGLEFALCWNRTTGKLECLCSGLITENDYASNPWMPGFKGAHAWRLPVAKALASL